MFSCEFCELFKNTYLTEDLQTAGSETPVRGSVFNKVTSLTAWRLLTVFRKRLSHRYTCISLRIFRNFLERFFVKHLATTSHMMLLSFPFCRSVRFAAENQFIWWSNGKLGEGIHKLVPSCVVMEIRWKLHCQVVATHVPTYASQ